MRIVIFLLPREVAAEASEMRSVHFVKSMGLIVDIMNKGNVNILMGFFGLGTCAMAVIGIWLGIKGFREREKIYTTCKVGITVNAVFLVAMVALFVRGLM